MGPSGSAHYASQSCERVRQYFQISSQIGALAMATGSELASGSKAHDFSGPSDGNCFSRRYALPLIIGTRGRCLAAPEMR